MKKNTTLQNDIDFLINVNTVYNDLLTEIAMLKDNLENARKDKEKLLSQNTLNYRLKCGIVLFLDIFININGIENFIVIPLFIVFVRELFKKQKLVRDNIVKLEEYIKYKECYKDELYEILCEARSLVNKRKKLEENESLAVEKDYGNSEYYGNENLESDIKISEVTMLPSELGKVLRLG